MLSPKTSSQHLYAFLLGSCLLCSSNAWAQQYETPPVFKASKVVDAKLAKGPNHKVQEEVRNDGYMNLYIVTSDFGQFDGRGKLRLQKLVQEIYILAKLKEISSSEVFVDAAQKAGVDIVMAPVHGAKKAYELVSEPEKLVDTVAAVPGGVARLFKSVGNRVQSGYESAKDTHRKGGETGYTRAYGGAAVDAATGLASDFTGYSKAMRHWQQEMGIDPYTTNEVLNAELKRIVRVESSVGVGKIFVPGIGLGIPYVGTVNRYKKRADDLALYEDPAVIKKRNEQAIEALGEVNEGNAKAFLNHNAITPTMRTFILDNLKSMEGVNKRGDFIDVAIQAQSIEDAVFFWQASEQLREYHKKVQPLDELVEGGLLPAGVTKKGHLVIPLPVDYLVWTKDVHKIFDNFVQRVQKEHKVAGSELRITGGASALCKKKMSEEGIRVVENVPYL